jgi:hypothetical protein
MTTSPSEKELLIARGDHFKVIANKKGIFCVIDRDDAELFKYVDSVLEAIYGKRLLYTIDRTDRKKNRKDRRVIWELIIRSDA